MFRSIINPFPWYFTPFSSTSFFSSSTLLLSAISRFKLYFCILIILFLLTFILVFYCLLITHNFFSRVLFSALLSFPRNKFDYSGGSGAYTTTNIDCKKSKQGRIFSITKVLKTISVLRQINPTGSEQVRGEMRCCSLLNMIRNFMRYRMCDWNENREHEAVYLISWWQQQHIYVYVIRLRIKQKCR